MRGVLDVESLLDSMLLGIQVRRASRKLLDNEVDCCSILMDSMDDKSTYIPMGMLDQQEGLILILK